MDTAVHAVLSRLSSVRRGPEGSWTAACPAHEDSNPSLCVSVGGGERVLLCCHAGCSTDDIVRAMGLEMKDLFERPRSTGSPPMTKSRQSRDWGRITAELEAAITAAQVQELAASLSVSPESLRALNVGWAPEASLRDLGAGGSGWREDYPAGAYSFPERDAVGGVIGVSFRTADGRKGTARGAARGLTYPTNPVCGGECLIVEGATDVAACLTMGMRAVGRPSCSGGAALLAAHLRGAEVMVVGENDQRGGAWPGRDGAERLADQLREAWGCAVRVSLPPEGAKDVRAFLRNCLDGASGGASAAVYVEARTLLLHHLQSNAWADQMPGGPLEWKPFPLDALPAPIAQYVAKASQAIQCDPAMVVLPMLAVLGAAAGTSREVEVKEDSWLEPLVVWSVIVARSGSCKSPAFRAAVSCLIDLDQRLYRDWEQGAASGVPESPGGRRPPCKRHVVEDITVEALAMVLRDNPQGVLLFRDELSGWFGSFDRYTSGTKGADSSRWLEAFSAGPWRIDRKTGPEHERQFRVESASVCITGTIQTPVLKRCVGSQHIENGLAARFLMAMPPVHPRTWNPDGVPANLREQVATIVGKLVSVPLQRDAAGSLKRTRMTLTPAARDAWKEFFDSHSKLQAEEPHEAIAAAMAKHEAYVARIAGIFQAVKWAADASNGLEITEDSLRRAIVIMEWFTHETRRVYEIVEEDASTTRRRSLAEWIRSVGGTVTARELTRSRREFKGDPKRAERELEELVKHGFGSFDWSEHDQTGGRPTRRFVLRRRSPAHPADETTPEGA